MTTKHIWGKFLTRGKSSFSHRALPRSRRAEEERKKTSPLGRERASVLKALLLAAVDRTLLAKQNKAKRRWREAASLLKKDAKGHAVILNLNTSILEYLLRILFSPKKSKKALLLLSVKLSINDLSRVDVI